MCARYNEAVGRHQALYEKLRNSGVISDADYESLDEIPTSLIPQLTQTLPGSDTVVDVSGGVSYSDDSTDWRLKYETLRRDIDMMQLQHALSPRPSHASPTHMDWKSMYTSIAEENETLRAKLGQFGLPTECPPEEDYVHLGTQYDIAIQENEMLRAQVTACENHQMAAQCAVRQTVESEYRLTTLDSTDESVAEQPQEVVEEVAMGTDVAVGDGFSFVSPRCSDSSHTLVDSPQKHVITDGRTVSQEIHETLVTEHARLQEMYGELQSRCELLAVECCGLQRKTDEHSQKTEEVEGLRRQVEATATLQDEVEGLKMQLAATAKLQHEAVALRSQLEAAKDTKPGPDSGHGGREGEEMPGKQEERNQQTAAEETSSLKDAYTALMATHETLKKEFESAQSKAKKDYTKMKAKAVAATRLAEGLKEQLRAAELGPDPNAPHPEASVSETSMSTISDSSEELEQLTKRLSILSDQCHEAEEELKSVAEVRDRCMEEIEQQKATIASLYQENGLLKEKVTDATAKINEVATQQQRAYALLVQENERVVSELKTTAVEREHIDKEVEALRKRCEEVAEEANTWRLDCEALQKETLRLQECARTGTENQESSAEENTKLRQELQSVCEEKAQLLVELQRDRDVQSQLEEQVRVERETSGDLRSRLTQREEELLGVSEQLAGVLEENQGVHKQLVETNEQLEVMKTQLNKHEQQVKELEAVKAELEVTKDELYSIKTEQTSMKTQLVFSNVDLESTKKNLESSESELESTKARLVSTQEQLESVNSELYSIKTAQGDMKVQLAFSNADLASSKSELESKTVELESTKARLESAQEQLESVNSELYSIKTSQEDMKLQLAFSNADLASSKSELESKTVELESTKARLESAQEQLESVNSELYSIKTAHEDMKVQLVFSNADLESSKSELASTKVELESTNAQLESLKVELESMSTQLVSTDSQLESVNTQLACLHQENTALRAQLAESQPTKLERLQKCEDSVHDARLRDEGRGHIIDSAQQVAAQVVSVPPENNNLDSMSNDRLAEMKQEVGDLTQQRDRLCEEKDSLQETNESLKETNDNLQERNESLQETNESLKEENDNLQATNKSLQATNESLRKKSETLCGENESLRVQLIEITDKVEEQVEKMQAAYAAVVEDNDNNLVEVKRLCTQLSAAEAQCHQLQTQLTSEASDTNHEDVVEENRRLSEELARVAALQQNDQAQLLQIEAKYKTLSEEHKALVAASSSRQHELQQLEERLRRSHGEQMEERAKELEDLRKERATEKEWFDAELQDWQCRYDALHQESRQLKKVLASGSSDTLTHEFLGLQRRYEQLVDEQRTLQCTADEHKSCASAAQTRVHELEARVAHLERLQQADASPVSVGEIRRSDKEHAETAGGDRPQLVFSCDDVDLGGADLAGGDHGGEDHGAQRRGGHHSQTGVTVTLNDPTNSASPVCFDTCSDGGSGGGSTVPVSGLSTPVDTGGSTELLVVTDSDRAASDTSGDTACCDDLTQMCDTGMTQKSEDDMYNQGRVTPSQGGTTPSQAKTKTTSKKGTTDKTSSRKQTAPTDKHLTAGTTKKKTVKGPVKGRVTTTVRQSGKGDTRQTKTTDSKGDTKKGKTAERESHTSASSSNNVSEMASLRLNNESLKRENQMLCEKMKRSSAKAAEELVKTKRLYENVLREKKELEMKISVQKQGSEHKTKTTESTRPRHDEKTLSRELSKLKREKSQLEKQLTEMRAKSGGMKSASRDGSVTSEQHTRAGSRQEDARQIGQGNWPDVVCVHCEILLAEKNDLCIKFDAERAQLKEEVEELSLRVSMSQTQETDLLTRKNKALTDQLRTVRGQLEQCSREGVNPTGGRHQVAQLSRQLNDVTLVNATLQKEATELRRQLDAALAVTRQSPQRQPGDGSPCSPNTPLAHSSPLVQRDTAVTPPSVLVTSFSDNTGLSCSKSQHMSGDHQSMTDDHQSMTGSCPRVTELSHAELLLQYEILLQEKRELCVRLDEKTTESEELAEKLTEARAAAEKTQDKPMTKRRGGRNKPTADTKCDKCQRLQTEKANLDEKFLELQVLHNSMLAERTQLSSERDHYKALTAECSAHSEALQMAQVECEKLRQDIAGLREELDRVANERQQLECKLDDMSFRNDELVATLETSGITEPHSVDVSVVEQGSDNSVQVRLDTCERQCKLLNTENCALVKELQQCRKELESVEEQLRSLESEKSHVERDLEECLSSKARLSGQLNTVAGGGCLRKQRQEPDVEKEREGEDTDQTDAGSVSDVQLKTCLIQSESHTRQNDGRMESGTMQDMDSREICRLIDEVENWRRLNSDLSRVCECLDSRVAALSTQVEQLSVVNRDLRAENAALVFDREDWTSGSEDRDGTEAELRGDVTSWSAAGQGKYPMLTHQTDPGQETQKHSQTSDCDCAEGETASGRPVDWDRKKDEEVRVASFDPEQRRDDLSGMMQAVRQAKSQLEQDVMPELGDNSQSKDVMTFGDSKSDETNIGNEMRTTDGEMRSPDVEMSRVAQKCQLKDDHIKRLETQLRRQQCDIQRAALEYKLLISLLSEVTSQQQHSDTSDTHRQCDTSVSTCLADGLPLSSMATLQQSVTDSPEELEQSPEMTSPVELREKADRLEMTVLQLTTDKASLSDRCRQQESVISQLRHQINAIDDSVSGDVTVASDVAEKQIALLQKQRDDLQHQVAALKEQSQKLVSTADDQSTLERKLSIEQMRCERLKEEKELLEQELLQERVALGRHIREQHQEQHRLLQQVAALQAGDNCDGSGKVGKKDRVRSRRDVGRDVRCYPLRGGACGKLRLRCGCFVEAGGRKMHAHCQYHRAIEQLRAALAHTNAKRHQQVAPAIPSSIYACDYVS